MKRLTLIGGALATALVISASSEALATPNPRLHTVATRSVEALNNVTARVTQDLQGGTLQASSRTGRPPVMIKLGPTIGKGKFGAIYRVEATPELQRELGVPEDAELVLKLAHTLRLPRHPHLPGGVSSIRHEESDGDLLVKQASVIEQSSHYPRDPAWKKGAMPVVKQAGLLETDRGPALIKYFLHARSLDKIPAGELTAEMRASLADIQGLAQSIADKVKIRRSNRPFYIDTSPENLFWVDDPATLERFGLSRPSFAFVELSAQPNAIISRIANYLMAR